MKFLCYLSNDLSDLETQVLPVGTQVLESIQLFGQETAAEAIHSVNIPHGHDETNDNDLNYFCEVFVCCFI